MLPRALAAHVDRFQALPSQGGLGGPGSAAEENFFARAFPDNDIPLERLDAARAAFDAAVGKGFPTGKGRPGTWVTIGPSNAIYPFFELRTAGLYVPNEYAAGGRTTTMAIDPNCRIGKCRLWIGAAGGGIWRTKNALTGQPSWEYLSDPSRSTRSAPSRSTRMTRAGTRSGSARARATRAAAVAWPAWDSIDRATAVIRGPVQSATPCSMAAASARSWSSPAIRTRSTPPRRARCSETRRSAAPARSH